MPTEVCSAINKGKRPAPASNARPLSSIAPKRASPYAGTGPKTSRPSAAIELPIAKR
jgi:hypothetical protein